MQEASIPIHFSGTDPRPVDAHWKWAQVLKTVCLRNADCASGMNLEPRMNACDFRDVKNVEYPFCVCNPWPDKPETKPIAEYTKTYVPNVLFGLLDQYAKEKYAAHEIQQMKDCATESAFSGKIDRLHWKFNVCVGRKAG